jgi:hypothetical protein
MRNSKLGATVSQFWNAAQVFGEEYSVVIGPRSEAVAADGGDIGFYIEGSPTCAADPKQLDETAKLIVKDLMCVFPGAYWPPEVSHTSGPLIAIRKIQDTELEGKVYMGEVYIWDLPNVYLSLSKLTMPIRYAYTSD